MATTNELIALGNDQDFRQRIRTLMLVQAGVVYNENPATANHTARANFASKIAQSPGLADALASALAARTNLQASVVTYDFNAHRVVTDATDAAISSQIATDWNYLAGV